MLRAGGGPRDPSLLMCTMHIVNMSLYIIMYIDIHITYVYNIHVHPLHLTSEQCELVVGGLAMNRLTDQQ